MVASAIGSVGGKDEVHSAGPTSPSHIGVVAERRAELILFLPTLIFLRCKMRDEKVWYRDACLEVVSCL